MTDAGASGGTKPYGYQWLVSFDNPLGPYTASSATAFCGSASTTLNCSFVTNYTSTKPGIYYFKIRANDSNGLTATSGYVAIKVNPHLVQIPTPTVVNSPILEGQQVLIAMDTMPNPLNGTPPYIYLWLVAHNGSITYSPATAVQCLTIAGSVLPGETLFCYSTTATPTGNYTYKVEVIDSSDPQNSISDNSTPAIINPAPHGSTSSSSTTTNTTSLTTIGSTSSSTTANSTSTLSSSTLSSSTTLQSTITTSTSTTTASTTTTVCPLGFTCAPTTTSTSTSTTSTICIPGINCVTTSTSTTTISGGIGPGGSTIPGGSPGGGGSYPPVVQCRQNGGLYCTASNVTQYATFSAKLCNTTQINVTENYITPIYAGVTINGKQYALYVGNVTQLSNVGPYYYVELVNISYLPIIQTIKLNFTATQCPVTTTVPPVNRTNTTTSVSTIRTTTLRTTIFIPFISSITSSTTVAISIIIAILIIIILILLIFFIMRKRKEEKEEEEARRRFGGGGSQPPSYAPPSPQQLRK